MVEAGDTVLRDSRIIQTRSRLVQSSPQTLNVSLVESPEDGFMSGQRTVRVSNLSDTSAHGALRTERLIASLE